MEPAKIDWGRVESIFVEEEMYEHINAPKWIDFLAAEASPVDDKSWFCKPDCNHPNTAEDFRHSSPLAKVSVSVETSETQLRSWNQIDGKLKRRAQNHNSPLPKEAENQDLNVCTPQIHRVKSTKETIKSSNDRKQLLTDDELTPTKQGRRLKSTMSASNLFGGKNVLVHLSEFYYELKKRAIGCREKQVDDVIMPEVKSTQVNPCEEISPNAQEKQRTPVLKPRRIRREDDAENIPVSLNVAQVKIQQGENSPKIRTKPPPPQRFSTTVVPKSTPTKNSKSRFMERGILKEVIQRKDMSAVEDSRDGDRELEPETEVREARAPDMFWFFKPCTQLANSSPKQKNNFEISNM